MKSRLRLNKSLRERLMTMAQGSLAPPPEEVEAIEVARLKAQDLVLAQLALQTDAAEMAVLIKHSAVSETGTVDVYHGRRKSDDSPIRQFGMHLTAGKFAYRARFSTSYKLDYNEALMSDQHFEIVDKWRVMNSKSQSDHQDRISDFRTLVDNCTHLDQVVDVWPGAAKLQSEMLGNRQVPSPVSQELVDRLRGYLK